MPSWDDGGMTGTRPVRKEACTLIKSFANPKKMLRIGNWNVRTMYSVRKTTQVVKEMQRFKSDIPGISECRWSDGLVLNGPRYRQVKLLCIREEMTTYTKVALRL